MDNQRQLIIFAGAGASAAVNFDNYPTTVGFRNRLPLNITSNPLFGFVEHFLQHEVKEGEPPFDIEKILWALQAFVKDLSFSFRQDSLAAYLIRSGQLGALIGTNVAGNVQSFLNQGHYAGERLMSEINAIVYDLYNREPTQTELEANWIPLLKWASRKFSKINVFTTNYDVVIETAINLVPEAKIGLGRLNGLGTTLSLHEWRDLTVDDRGLLTKLHGSVDWQFGRGGSPTTPIVRTGIPEFLNDHNVRTIIYPGFKGIPDREPFVAFHEYLRSQLAKATHLICVGFAFRDEHLNRIFTEHKRSDRLSLVIDPAPKSLADYSDLGQVTVEKRGFSNFAGDGLLSGSPWLEEVLDSWVERRVIASGAT
ncbi:MAG: SIR2 family protein [Burkholderiaceae bacterium]